MDNVTVASVETTNTTAINMPPVNNWSEPFLRTVFSAADGTGSAARVGIMTVIFAAIVWVSWCVARNHSIPDLTGLTLYETSIITVLYAPNKISDV